MHSEGVWNQELCAQAFCRLLQQVDTGQRVIICCAKGNDSKVELSLERWEVV